MGKTIVVLRTVYEAALAVMLLLGAVCALAALVMFLGYLTGYLDSGWLLPAVMSTIAGALFSAAAEKGKLEKKS